MRLIISALLLMTSASAVFAQEKKFEEYPVAERRLFVDGCMNGNPLMHDFCVCVLTKFQDTLTFKEYAAMNEMTDEQLRSYKPYASAILTCVDEVK